MTIIRRVMILGKVCQSWAWVLPGHIREFKYMVETEPTRLSPVLAVSGTSSSTTTSWAATRWPRKRSSAEQQRA